ncbi:hypothetical protein MASR2M12_24900 [Bacteroidales bacterium]
MKKGFLLVSILLIINSLQFAKAEGKNEGPGSARSQEVSSAAYLHSLRANQTTGEVNLADVVKASIEARSLTSGRSSSGLDWTSLGPDNFGGKTKGIVYDNKDASGQTIFAGATGGGIWKSVNGGITWNPVANANMMVSAMIQTASGEIYVGTGDGFNSQVTSVLGDLGYSTGFMGNGIWKSTDGQTFSQITSTIPQLNNNSSGWAFVNELVANGNGHLFAATNGGLRYSTDGGNTWLLAKDSNGNELSQNAQDIQIASDGTLGAVVDKKVYISKNGPDAFQLISTDEANMLPSIDVTRARLAFAPSNPSIVYAALVNNLGVQIGIYRSDNKGDSWSVILPATSTVNIFGSRGNQNNVLVVFPNDPDRLIVGGSRLSQGRKVVAEGLFAWDIESTTGGAGFLPNYLHFGVERVVFKPGSSNEFFVATAGGVQQGHLNGEDYVFSINNRNYITSQYYAVAPSGRENRILGGSQDQGTIFISGEGNSERQGETVYRDGLPGGPVVVSTINPTAMVVTTDKGAMQRSEDMGFTFSNQFKPVDNMNPQAYLTPIALWESYDDQLSGDSVTFHAKRNYSGGETIKAKSKNFDHPFYYKLPANQNLVIGDTLRVKDIVTTKLFIATANKIWMTREFLNFGKLPLWFEISNASVGFAGMPQSIGLSKDANHLFVGTKDGKLFRISNIAIAYNYERAHVSSPACVIATKEIPVYLPGTSTPISQAITSVSVDPSNANNVIITLANYGNEHYVYGTTNALDATPTFTSRQGNLPKAPIYSSLLEMSNSGLAFVGTEFGLYKTTNVFEASPNWVADQTMSNIPVFDLKQQLINKSSDTLQLINGPETTIKEFWGTNNLGIVYAATFGKGLYRCNEYRKPVGIEEHTPAEVSAATLTIYPNPIRDNNAKVSFELKAQSSVSVDIFDFQGRLVSRETIGNLAIGKHQYMLMTRQLTPGSYILKLNASGNTMTSKFLVY